MTPLTRCTWRGALRYRKKFLILIALIFTGMMQAANAEPTLDFDIPSQSLSTALTGFSAKTRLQVLYDGAIGDQIQVPALKGKYTPTGALEKLLENSDIQYRFTNEKTVTLEPRVEGLLSTEYLLAQAPKEKYPATEIEQPDYDGPVEQEDLTVRGAPMSAYNVLNSTTATKTDTPIMETPVSVQVVPQAVIRDQQAINLQDAIKNVSGVIPALGFSYREDFLVRGFNTRDFQRRDGFLVRLTRQPLANVDRVEVLKGPTAILYGNIEPGGLINVVTKRPQSESYYSLSQQFGSFNTFRTLADATGALNSDGSLSYRLNFEYLDQDSYRDFISIDRKLVAPSLTWRNGRTQVDLDFMYQNEVNAIDLGIPALGNRPAPVPINRSLGEPFGSTSTVSYVSALTARHDLNDNWNITGRFQAEITDAGVIQIGHTGLNEVTGDINRNALTTSVNQDTYFGSLNLTGKFSTFGLDHTLLIGGDYYNFKYLEINRFFTAPPFVNGPINIFNPVYGMISNEFTSKAIPPNNSFGSRQSWFGAYIQDQIAIGEAWRLLAGFRYDDVEATQLRNFPVTELPGGLDTGNFAPRVGLLYRPVPWLSLFGSYTEGYTVPIFSNSPQPQLSHQYEAGLKTEFFDGRLTGTLTYYNLTKTNIQTPTGIPNVFDTAGEVRNQGVELDLSGALTDDWRLIGSFSYIDSEITKDRDNSGGSGNQGNRLTNVPEFSGSLWTTYDFGSLGAPGLSAGAGAFFVGQREGDNANTFQLPGYGRVDMMLGYSRTIGPTKASIQFNIENLLDKEYFASSRNRNNILPGASRTFFGQVRIEY